MPRSAPFSQADARAAVAGSTCWADALRFLGYAVKAANYRTLQQWVARWGIPTDHFDPNARRAAATAARATPLEQVLVKDSSNSNRGRLKRRLYEAGLKRRCCELCGQGERWKGGTMSLILDHANGVPNDNRLENRRIVCPNCAATLETHCGRSLPRERICPGCKLPFEPRNIQHRYCSGKCWGTVAASRYQGIPHPQTRKVDRPSYERLMDEVQATSFVAVGRKYGVSDKAVRKWIRWYERQAARERGLPDEEAGANDRAA